MVTASVNGVSGTAEVTVASPGSSFLIGDEIWAVKVNSDGSTTVAGAFTGTLGAGTALRSRGGLDGFGAPGGLREKARWWWTSGNR